MKRTTIYAAGLGVFAFCIDLSQSPENRLQLQMVLWTLAILCISYDVGRRTIQRNAQGPIFLALFLLHCIFLYAAVRGHWLPSTSSMMIFLFAIPEAAMMGYLSFWLGKLLGAEQPKV